MSKKNENLLDISFEEINRRLKNGLKIVCYNITVAQMIHIVMDAVYDTYCIVYTDENKFFIEELL